MQRLRPEERREFQRLSLHPPITGTLGSTEVSIQEIGVLGGRLQHAAPIDMQYAELRFSREGDDIAMKCEIVRPNASTRADAKMAYESGVRFLAAIADSGDRLRDMLGELVTEAINARRASGAPSFV